MKSFQITVEIFCGTCTIWKLCAVTLVLWNIPFIFRFSPVDFNKKNRSLKSALWCAEKILNNSIYKLYGAVSYYKYIKHKTLNLRSKFKMNLKF